MLYKVQIYLIVELCEKNAPLKKTFDSSGRATEFICSFNNRPCFILVVHAAETAEGDSAVYLQTCSHTSSAEEMGAGGKEKRGG
jgi:hypothetical protein